MEKWCSFECFFGSEETLKGFSYAAVNLFYKAQRLDVYVQ
jgi:hypothetical protein